LIFYQLLNRLLFSVVQDFNLDRTHNPVVYFGKAEVKLMVQAALDASETSGRIVRLQTICTIMLQFYLGSRPGSLAASAKIFRDRKQVSMS
jgi:hypothetical protein